MTYAHGSGASLGTHSPPKLPTAELFELETFPLIAEIERPAACPDLESRDLSDPAASFPVAPRGRRAIRAVVPPLRPV